MKEFLLTNIESIQPKWEDGPAIVLYGRPPDDPSEAYEIRVHDFRPYFFAPEQEVKDKENMLLGQDSIAEVEYGDYVSFKNEIDLAKIYPPYPQDTREAREFFDAGHFMADVPFTRRFLVDKEIYSAFSIPESAIDGQGADVHHTEIEPPGTTSSAVNPQGTDGKIGSTEPRVLTIDIEVDDSAGFPENGEERILSVVAHDSLTGEYVGFLDLDGRDIEEWLPDGAPDPLDELHVQDTERKMLIDFRTWYQQRNPDLITGWNVADFDVSYIISRFRRVDGLNEDVFSRTGWAGFRSGGDPTLKGHTIYDLLTAYKANQFRELDSYKLDDIAEEELGAEKISYGYDSLFELYEEEPEKFIEYNAHDVELCVEIDEKADVIEFRDILRRQVGVPFEDSINNKDFLDVMCRRQLKKRGKIPPSRPDYGEEPESDYEGAHVFDAYEGVASNVAGLDLASLYPYTMAMMNASPETVVDPDEYDGHTYRAANGAHFRSDKDGLFKELVDDAISLKSKYKQAIREATGGNEREKAERLYMVAKTITNSIYGVTGWERFFLYDKDVAEAVTITGQEVIKRTARHAEESGASVLYGDTDSVYIQFPEEWETEQCVEGGQDLASELNRDVYPTFCQEFGVPPEDNLWEIELEAVMSRFFQAGKKKKYAYIPAWKDGHYVEDAEPNVVGFSSVRSDSAKLTSETMQEVIEGILRGHQDEVGKMVFAAASGIHRKPAGEEWNIIGIPQGLNKALTEYEFDEDGYPQDAHPRAVWNANKILSEAEVDPSQKPKRVYLKPRAFDEVGRKIDVIAFEDPSDLSEIEGRIEVDVERMTNKLLVRPLRHILNAVGVDAKAAVRGQEQTGLGCFTE